jgi:hypothetical protein
LIFKFSFCLSASSKAVSGAPSRPRWVPVSLQLHYEMQRVRLELGKRIDLEVQPAA